MKRILPLLAAILISLFIGNILLILRVLIGTKLPTFLLLALVLSASIEGFYLTQSFLVKKVNPLLRSSYRRIEIVAFLIIARLLSFFNQNFAGQKAYLEGWWKNPFTIIFDGVFIAYAFLIFLSWGLSLRLAYDIDSLLPKPSEAPPPTGSDAYYLWLTSRSNVDRVTPVQRMGRYYISGALLLLSGNVFISVLAGTVPEIKARINPQPIVYTILYLLLGIWYMSLIVLTKNKTLWRLGNLNPSFGISRNWVKYTACVISAVAIISSFLPIGYNILPGAALYDFLNRILSFLFGFLISFVLFIFYFLTRIIKFISQPGSTSPSPVPSLNELKSGSSHTFNSIKNIGIWSLRVGLIFLMILAFLRKGGRLGAFLRRLNWKKIMELWKAFYERWKKMLSMVRQKSVTQIYKFTRRRKKVKIPEVTKSLPQFLHWRKLSAQELIKFFYLSILHRASQTGYPRKFWETPWEYYRSIHNIASPEIDFDMLQLTEKFLEARYSPHSLKQKDIRRAYRHWRALRRKLRPLLRRRD